MKMIRNKKGFTLIELIIIIVILGILAAIAVPKYLDMQADARKAVAAGALGALSGADNILFAQQIITPTLTYNFASVLSNANAQGWTATTGAIAVGTGTNAPTYTIIYTAGDTTKPGTYQRSGW